MTDRSQSLGAVWAIAKEAARHILKRPVVGIVAAARTPAGEWVLVRRGDTGTWAMPGGTLEWGETLRSAIERELLEEAGVEVRSLGDLVGVYSAPWRDLRFHAVTVVVHAEVSTPRQRQLNAVEIREVGTFTDSALPANLAHGMNEMLDAARRHRTAWE